MIKKQLSQKSGLLSRKDRYLAASAYLFDAGYLFMSWLQHQEPLNEFLQFHLAQANRFIKYFVLPGLVLFLIWLFVAENVTILLILFLLSVLVYLCFSVVGAYHALTGRMKKVL